MTYVNPAVLSLLWLWTLAISPAQADPRVLIIGIDGAGGRYVQTANTPHLDALAAGGAVRYDFLNEGALVANPPESYGASGVNWSTILTGASAASHKVSDNSFNGNNFAEVPSLFHYVKRDHPTLSTASIVHWSPINTHIIVDQDVSLEIASLSDVEVKNEAVNLLAAGNPQAIFLHFDDVDHAGHSHSWGSPEFYQAIEVVDGLVGEVMAALNDRPGVINGTEDWLVMVTADHGGALGSFSHVASQGPSNWQVPLFISGPSISDGVDLPQGNLRDIATTALWHLGVDPYGTTTEGQVVGLSDYVLGPPNGIGGDVNQNGVVAGDGTGDAADDDVTAFVEGWLSTGHRTVLEGYQHGDLNLDRVTDLKDWVILNQLSPAMGQAVANAVLAVPEPKSVNLLVPVILMQVLRRQVDRQ